MIYWQQLCGWLRCGLRTGSIGIACTFALAHLASATVFYEFDIIAQTGTNTAAGNISGLAGGPSISDDGDVAFIGQASSAPVGALFIGNGEGNMPEWISVGINPTFSNGIQINNNRLVVSRDRSSGAPPPTIIRRWDGPGSYLKVGRSPNAGVPLFSNSPYDAVVAFPSLNNTGDVVFLALPATHHDPGNVLKLVYAGNNDIPFLATETSCASYLSRVKEATLPFQSLVQPMVADNGNFVVTVDDGAGENAEVRLYDPSASVVTPGECAGFSPLVNDMTNAYTTIAQVGAGFDQLGRSPGISDDGKVIVFVGDRDNNNNNPGIFASIDNGTGTRTLVRIAGENLGSSGPRPELGFDDAGGPLFFKTFAMTSRVAVIHLDLGMPGIVDNGDSFIVVFIATPSAASRNNPITKSPLTFTQNEGLWTVRVDAVESLVAGSTKLVFNPTSPIPVVQVGDTVQTPLGPRVIDSIAVYDPLANAPTDNVGFSRFQRRGDHRVAFWAQSGSGSLIVRGTHLDSDQDGLLDHWETIGIDADQDGTIDLNLADMGADPNQRDLFVEIDWLAPHVTSTHTRDFSPLPEAIDFLVTMFANAPDPIKVHVDAGTGRSRNMGGDAKLLQGGDQIRAFSGGPHVDVVYFGIPDTLTFPGVVSRAFDDIKDNLFGTIDNRAREFAFHYVVFADRLGGPGTILGNSGEAEIDFRSYDRSTMSDLGTIPGNDVLITLQGIRSIPPFPRGFLQAQILAHELGHNLGLRHGGVDNVTSPPPSHPEHIPSEYKPRYLSLMNYAYQEGLFGSVTAAIGNTITAASTPFTGIGGDADLLGLPVLIFRGTGIGQTRDILSNTATQLTTALPSWSPIPDNTSRFDILVQNYSQAGDPVFDDWENIQLDFHNYANHLGNSFNIGGFGPPGVADPEPDLDVLESIIGPFDREIPRVIIQRPAPSTVIPMFSTIMVVVTATDDSGIGSVEVVFDIDGDGSVEGTGESVLAVNTGPNTFEAMFANVAVSSDPRTISVSATDISGAVGEATTTVTVSTTPMVVVPNVVGQVQASAEATLTAAGLVVGTVSTAFSSTVPAGAVISQSPTAGTSVVPGSAVNLVISSGPMLVTVPNVVTLDQASAEATITAVGLVVGTVTTANDNSIPAGNIISQNPAGGSSVSAGSAVDLVLSLGPATVTVPNVLGQDQASAEATITAAGLVVGTVSTVHNATIPAGNVISQNPSAGAAVAPSSTVTLVVSSGPTAPIPGDLDGDGDVDGNDVQAFRAVLGTSQGSPSFNPAADFDRDGRITINDLRIMRSLLP